MAGGVSLFAGLALAGAAGAGFGFAGLGVSGVLAGLGDRLGGRLFAHGRQPAIFPVAYQRRVEPGSGVGWPLAEKGD